MSVRNPLITIIQLMLSLLTCLQVITIKRLPSYYETRILDATNFEQLQLTTVFVKSLILNRPTKFFDQTTTLKLGRVSSMKGKTYQP